MEIKGKKLINSFSTGGGGYHFEGHVQASFVTLMLSGGYAPCLPCWPIVEIKLQGKIEGFETDDIIVIVRNKSTKEKRKLLIQVKHSIKITKGCTYHGLAINVAMDLEPFTGINPCGYEGLRTIDMQSLGIKATVEEVSDKVVEELQNIFSAKLALAD